MAERSKDDVISFEALSALVDNEATDRDVQRAMQAWRDEPEARERWNSYHLVGDVMRSEGLARGKTSDADFLASLRGRLAEEPVVLAPASLPQGAPAAAAPVAPNVVPLQTVRELRHRRWAGPVSVAAGFVMVLSAVVSTLNGGGLPQGDAGQLAQAPATPSLGVPSLAQGFAGADLGLTAGLPVTQRAALSDQTPSFNENAQGRRNYLVLMRDDQLDQLMAAQRELGASRSLTSSQPTLSHISAGGVAP